MTYYSSVYKDRSLTKTRDNILRTEQKAFLTKANSKAQNTRNRVKSTGLNNMLSLISSSDIRSLGGLGVDINLETLSTYMTISYIITARDYVYGTISCKD